MSSSKRRSKQSTDYTKFRDNTATADPPLRCYARYQFAPFGSPSLCPGIVGIYLLDVRRREGFRFGNNVTIKGHDL
jgi:hypothetical protein